jgi:patatin-like phospholipase/acyl hydrolase
MGNISQIRAATSEILLNQLLIPDSKEFKAVDWEHVVSLTSYPERFNTLSQTLNSLLAQRLIAKKIYLNIAQEDMSKLPASVKDFASSGLININACENLGPGKKLIPTLKLEKNLPIIVVDDDLIFDTDLTLKLMIVHHLSPGTIIASRVHKIAHTPEGEVSAYSKWQKNYSLSNGPSMDLFATSGAGTLYKADFFHEDVTDEKTYSELAFHTDDLWWFIQSKRVGTKTKRLPGQSVLNYIDGTQEIGLWNNGNKERNDLNLKALMKRYSL